MEEAYEFSHGVSGARRDRRASRSESNDELRWQPWLGLVAIKAGWLATRTGTHHGDDPGLLRIGRWTGSCLSHLGG